MALQLPSLKKLTTNNYEINQIQDYTSNAFSQVNNYISGLSNNHAIVGLSTENSFGSGTNYYVVFNNSISDPQNAYNVTNGIFTAPITGFVQVTANILVQAGSGTFGLVAQVNRTAIAGGASFITNYDLRICYIESGSSGLVLLSGTNFLNLNQNDKVSLVYSTTVASSIFNASPDAQVSFLW